MLFKKQKYIFEENIKIPIFGNKISKQLKVFYNPDMKLNRDISLLVIKSYFEKQIDFCDPMIASGIREMRFLKTIPSSFKSLTLGDISAFAIKTTKKNFKINKIPYKKCNFLIQDAISTINKKYYDFIEIDPFGSPVPFLDMALQRIKHNGILSITATDTAALCGTYPKTTKRKYNIDVKMTQFHEELGLRNLIAYTQIQAAKYNLALTPQISYSNKHYYKIFFKVEESKTKSLVNINKLRYFKIDKKTQKIEISKYQKDETYLGKTYIGSLNNKEFILKLKENLSLLKDIKEINKLLDKLYLELDIFAYYNPHKLQKEFKLSKAITFEKIEKELEKKGYKVSRPHNNRLGIKTNAPYTSLIEILK